MAAARAAAVFRDVLSLHQRHAQCRGRCIDCVVTFRRLYVQAAEFAECRKFAQLCSTADELISGSGVSGKGYVRIDAHVRACGRPIGAHRAGDAQLIDVGNVNCEARVPMLRLRRIEKVLPHRALFRCIVLPPSGEIA